MRGASTLTVLELITSGAWGGAQAQVLAISRELLSRGHEVHVACGAPDDLLKRVAAAGARPHLLRRLRRPVAPLSDLTAWSEVAALLDRLRPDVLHTHSSKAGVIGRLSAAVHRRRRRARIEVVHTCHGFAWGPGRPGGRMMGAAYRLAERFTGRLCGHVIAVSEGILAQIQRERLFPTAHLVMVYDGVDVGLPGPGPFQTLPDSRRALGLPERGPLVIMVARLAPGKGHLAAIEAVSALPPQAEPVNLILVGDGPLRGAVEAAAGVARRPGLAVHLLGQRNDVPELLRASDLFLLPSSAEGLGLAPIEAMGACLPVVGFRVPGMVEVVANGETGLLVDPNCPRGALAAAVGRLLADHELARRMGMSGRARAQDLFSLDNTSRAVDFLCGVGRCPESGHSWEVAGG